MLLGNSFLLGRHQLITDINFGINVQIAILQAYLCFAAETNKDLWQSKHFKKFISSFVLSKTFFRHVFAHGPQMDHFIEH